MTLWLVCLIAYGAGVFSAVAAMLVGRANGRKP